MARSEKSILNDALVEISRIPDTLCWRNNTGQAWQGKKEDVFIGQFVKIEPGTVVLREARPVNFGVPGSPDIIGATNGRPLGAEIKTETGRQSDLQRNFQRRWEQVGGIYVLARSESDAVSQIKARIKS